MVTMTTNQKTRLLVAARDVEKALQSERNNEHDLFAKITTLNYELRTLQPVWLPGRGCDAEMAFASR
jgi:hypothetical protein